MVDTESGPIWMMDFARVIPISHILGASLAMATMAESLGTPQANSRIMPACSGDEREERGERREKKESRE